MKPVAEENVAEVTQVAVVVMAAVAVNVVAAAAVFVTSQVNAGKIEADRVLVVRAEKAASEEDVPDQI